MTITITDSDATHASSSPLSLDYAFVSILLALGASMAWLATLQLGVIARVFSLNYSAAGSVVTLEMLCTTIAAFGLSQFLIRLSLPRVALFASLVALSTQLLSCFDIGLYTFIAVRVIAGLASGTLYACACRYASLRRSGVRMIGVAFIFANVVFGASLTVLPEIIEQRGEVYLFIAQSLLFLLPVIVSLFSKSLSWSTPHAYETGDERKANPHALIFLLLCCGLGNGGLQMLRTFSEVAAQARGFDAKTIGLILGATTLFSILGSAIATLIDKRWGVRFPLALGLLGGALAGAVIATSGTLHQFSAGMFIFGIAAFFSLPYQIGAGSVLDSNGRAVTLAGVTAYFSGAVGPVLGGLINDHLSQIAVGWAASSACVFAALCALGIRHHSIKPSIVQL